MINIINSKYVFPELLGNTVTIMSPEGKPIQVNAGALQAAAAQNAAGMLELIKEITEICLN